jgi:MFS family permease
MQSVLRARNAVGLTFFLNGFVFATWVSRIPDVRASLDLDNGQLGLLLLCLAAGSVLALPCAGAAINRLGTVTVIRGAGVLAAAGLFLLAVAADGFGAPAAAAAGLFAYGIGTGVWDVAMNVEGADVERRLGRTIMPRFHAGFSLGTVAGAAVGALCTAIGVAPRWHIPVAVVLSIALTVLSARAFPPVQADLTSTRGSALAAWREPTTLLIGLMVLALALTEGTANDWLAVALVDGYDAVHWVAVTGFAVFVASMTLGRWFGPALLDRHGRVPVLWATMAAAAAGVLLVVFGGHPAVVVAGIVLWGLGASLGFPVGMSAAADDPVHAAARVSVVSTIGYAAFLGGPPFIGFVADQVGTLRALLVVAVLLLPSALVVPAARKRQVSG